MYDDVHISLTYTVAGSDYQSTTMRKTFNAGNVEQCLNVAIQQDEIYEYWEIFNITLALVSPISDRIMITRSSTDVVIIDDESRSNMLYNSMHDNAPLMTVTLHVSLWYI